MSRMKWIAPPGPDGVERSAAFGDCSKEGVSILRILSVLAVFSGFSATLEITAWSRALIATLPAGQMALHGLRQAGVQQYHTPSLLQSQ